MSLWNAIAGVVMFAAVTAFLYVWGLKKSLGQKEDMSRSLLHACGSKVLRHLKKHGTVSRSEIAKLIEGTTVHPMWSRHRMSVKNGGEYAPVVIEFLLDQQYIQPDGANSFRLRK